MSSVEARLLLAVRTRDSIRSAVAHRLPGISAVFLEESTPADWRYVDAALLGSIAREASSWEPSATPRLRFVQRIFTGVDDLPFDRFPPSVEIAGNVGGYAPFVAEHAVALALAAARTLVTAHAQAAAGRLRPSPDNRTLWHRTVVILGYGEIGREIARRLTGFGVRIVGVNRTGSLAPGCDEMVPADRLREALRRGEVVFDARPLTRATRATIGTAELEAMPADAILVNVGRAATIDEEALYRHLVAHPEFRAGLDVWWGEGFGDGTLRFRYPFLSLPNVVGTPHSAGFAPGVEAYALETALENLGRYFHGDAPLHRVDRSEYEAPR
ncbi:MAG: 2-hydroxyacid dehydrogenase [Thermoplasmata archaeon]